LREGSEIVTAQYRGGFPVVPTTIYSGSYPGGQAEWREKMAQLAAESLETTWDSPPVPPIWSDSRIVADSVRPATDTIPRRIIPTDQTPEEWHLRACRLIQLAQSIDEFDRTLVSLAGAKQLASDPSRPRIIEDLARLGRNSDGVAEWDTDMEGADRPAQNDGLRRIALALLIAERLAKTEGKDSFRALLNDWRGEGEIVSMERRGSQWVLNDVMTARYGRKYIGEGEGHRHERTELYALGLRERIVDLPVMITEPVDGEKWTVVPRPEEDIDG
jgi:hypothetical protein